MSYTNSDPSGGYFDPTTGMYVPGTESTSIAQTPTPVTSALQSGFGAVGDAFSRAMARAHAMGVTPGSAALADDAKAQETQAAIAAMQPRVETPGPVGQRTDSTATPEQLKATQAAIAAMPSQAPVAAALGPQGPSPDPYAQAPSPAAQMASAAPVDAALKQPSVTQPANASPDSSGPRDYSDLVAPLVAGESGGKADAKNPNSSATGLGGFLDSTWGDFLKSPANTGNWTMADRGNAAANSAAVKWYAGQNDSVFQSALGRPATNDELLASHLFGGAGAAALAKNPDGDAYTTLKALEPGTVDTVFSANGKLLQKGMTGAQALASVSGYYNGQKPSMVASSPTTPDATSGSAPGGAGATPAAYDPNTDPTIARIKAMAKAFGVQNPTQNDRLLTLASGLLSGPTFGQGLGKGAAGIVGLNQEQNKNAQQLMQMGIQSEYHDALLGNSRIGLGIRQQTADNGTARVGQGQQRVDAYVNSQGQRFNPQTQAALKQSATAGVDAEKDINSVMAGQQADEQSLKDTQQAQALIQQHPEMMGPTLQARATRALAENGIAGDPNTLNALQKMTADQRNTYLSSLTAGHVGGIRSNQELKNLSQAVADVSTSPKAAQWIIQMQSQQTQARMAWRQELQARSQTPEGMDSITGRQYNMTKNSFFNDYYKAHPLPDYDGGAAPSSAPAPGSTPQGGTKGVTTIHYDAQGNPIQ